MVIFMRIFTYYFLLAAAMLANNLFSVPLVLSAGDTSLGGTASVSANIELDSNFTMDLDLAPTASRLFTDAWELGLRPNMNVKFLRRVPLAHRVDWGLEIFSRWYFNTHDVIKFYAGSSIGMRLFDFSGSTIKWTLGGETGILIGLSEKIALDVGIPVTFYFDRLSGFNRVEIPIGYYGLRAFF